MNKLLLKLVSVSLMFVISLLMVVMITYAWMTMTGAPEVAGIQISIGGTNTILIAPDIALTTDTGTVHYPGAFDETLDFSSASGYEYLRQVKGLTPYSTADGIHWFGSAYYDQSADGALFGQLLSLQQLPMDELLQNANIVNSDSQEDGCYVYLDFWVVSPTSCTLRIATGDVQSGSFVIDLKDVERKETADDNPIKFQLSESGQPVSASVRVGFLSNTEVLTNGSMEAYMRSRDFSAQYGCLRGIYQEPGESYQHTSRFTVFEPNGDLHGDIASYIYTESGVLSNRTFENGSYVLTRPIGLVDGVPAPVDISDILAVQTTSSWNLADNGQSDMIDQVFQSYLFGKLGQNLSERELFDDFYTGYLHYQYFSYLSAGSFITDTRELYRAADADGVVGKDILDQLDQSGATESVYITTLEKDVPQRIRMYVWIEGQDPDCVNDASGKNFAINLKLAGSNK